MTEYTYNRTKRKEKSTLRSFLILNCPSPLSHIHLPFLFVPQFQFFRWYHRLEKWSNFRPINCESVRFVDKKKSTPENNINVPILSLLYLILAWVFTVTLKLALIFSEQLPYPLEVWFILKSKPIYQMLWSCLKVELTSRLFVWAQFLSEVGPHYGFINPNKSAAEADTQRNQGKHSEW